MGSELCIVIMAAGQGKRMNSNLPKVLHKFNCTPFLVRIINESQILEPNKIIVVVGKDEKLIVNTLTEYSVKIDNIVFVRQPIPNGTGDAVKCSLDYITEKNVLILNGDMPLIKAHTIENFISEENTKFVGRILVAQLEDPEHYGRIIMENNQFVGILEYKDCNDVERKIDIINAGIYYFKTNILKKYITRITNNNAQSEYYLTDIIRVLSPNYIMDTYLIDKELNYQILGINTQSELEKLEDLYGNNV
jgi:UDP-N-acetylglucosamine diphosphorylase/glucosamine-1-phosphate N-acetyltransferase